MRAWMALVWLSSGLLGVFQGSQAKRFLPNYIHRGLAVDRRGFLNLDSAQLKRCTVDDLVRVVSVEDLRKLIEGVAKRQGTKPLSVLRRILALEVAERGSEIYHPEQRELEANLQRLAMSDLFGSVLTLPPASPNLPPPPRAFLPSPGESVPFPPSNAVPPRIRPGTHRVHPSVHQDRDKIYNGLPPMILGPFPAPQTPPDSAGTSDLFQSKDDSEELVRGNLPYPSFNYPMSGFRPPAGATVSVDAGELLEAIPEVLITVSPLMTVVEALRQADFRFQHLLDLSDEDDVFEFAQSPIRGCYVISSVGSTRSSSEKLWRILVSDRNDQVVYQNVCLPTGRQVMVKPGMKISLAYDIV